MTHQRRERWQRSRRANRRFKRQMRRLYETFYLSLTYSIVRDEMYERTAGEPRA